MQALVIVGHGSHLNPGSSDPAFDHADTIRRSGAFDEVREAFWKEEPHVREVLRTLESDEVFVVPLFVSEGYFTEQVVPRELRLEGWEVSDWGSDGTDADHATMEATDVGKTVHYCGPVGTHDSMSDVIVQRAKSVTGDEDVGTGFGLAVVGHGTERNENSAKAIHYHAARIRESGRFDQVEALFMDEEPEVDDVTDFFSGEAHCVRESQSDSRSRPKSSAFRDDERRHSRLSNHPPEARTASEDASDGTSGQGPRDIVVVPLFIADGFHTREDIPEDMGLTDDYRAGWAVPSEVDGHRIWYAGAVGTEPFVADVILERALDAGADARAALDSVRAETGGVGSAGTGDLATESDAGAKGD